MATSLISRIGALKSIFIDFRHLGLLQFSKRRWLYHTALSSSSALLLDNHVYDSVIVGERNCGFDDDEIGCVRGKGLHNRESRMMYRDLIRVFHTLDWRVAREVKFPMVAERFGIGYAFDVFRVLVHCFAIAGMRMEVFALLRCMMEYYREEVGRDMVEMVGLLLDSREHGERSSVVCNVLIKVLAANSMLESALDVVFYAKKVGLELEILSCNFLLKCMAEVKEGALVERLYEEMKILGPSPNIYTYTIVLKFFCDVAFGRNQVHIIKANEIFADMEKHGVIPNVVTYGVYFDGLCKAGYVDHVCDGIRILRNQNHLNVYCYNAVIKGFCQQGKTREAERLFHDMQAHGISPDIYSYNILVDGFCRDGDIVKGKAFFEEMKRHNFKPTLESYTSLIGGLCRKGLMDDSLKMFESIKDSGYAIDKALYDVLMKGFCKNGYPYCANELFHEMICHELVPGEYSFNTLIHGFCKRGLLDEAMVCYNDMVHRGIPPSATICNVILQGYCEIRKLGEALKFMNEMRSRGICPNLFSYNAVTDGICKEINPERAWELFALMLKVGALPNVVTYSSIIDGYAKSYHIKKARLLHRKMLKVGVMEDVVMRTILINMYTSSDQVRRGNVAPKRKRKVRRGYRIFKDMIDGGVTVDVVSYTSMISAFCKIRDMQFAMKLFCDMKSREISPTAFTYNCLIDGYSKLNRMDEADWLFDEMKRNGIAANEVTYTNFIASYHRLRKHDRAQEYEKMRSQGLHRKATACRTHGLDASIVNNS